MATDTREKILHILKDAEAGLSTADLCKKLGYERHTMVKYLEALRAEKLIEVRALGRTKLWNLNKAPLITLFNAEHQLSESFKEILNNLDEQIYLISKEKEIVWANDKAKQTPKKCFHNFNKSEACINCPADLSLRTGQKEVYLRDFEGKNLKVAAVPIKDVHGNAVAFLEIVKEE